MYIKKRFTGTIEDNNFRESVLETNGGTIFDYSNQSKVLRNAIVETFRSKNIECSSDEGTCIINVNGFKFDLLYTSTNVYNVRSVGMSIFQTSAGTSYQPFNGNNYDFCITVAGDMKSAFNIFIGTYSSPESKNYGVFIANAVNVRKKEKRIFIRKSEQVFTSSGCEAYVRDTNGNKVEDYVRSDGSIFDSLVKWSSEKFDYDYSYSISEFRKLVPLFPLFTNNKMYMFTSAYEKPNYSGVMSSEFFRVNDKLYYTANYNMAVEMSE